MKACNAARPANLLRASPTAAAIPSAVEITATSSPTLRLVHVASIHERLWKYTSYQRREKRGGGNCISVESLNDIGITTSSGAIRNTTIAATVMRSNVQPMSGGR